MPTPNGNEQYAPFNILAFGDKLLVSYALQLLPEAGDDDAGPGRGFVDIFDTDGNFIQRLLSHGALNSPWGMAVSREHGNDLDLLVGNFGDGHINVYGLSMFGKRVAASSEGALKVVNSKKSDDPFVISPGLWGFAFGSGKGGFDTDDIYFAAGPNIPPDTELEDAGAFGELDFVGPRR